MCYVLSPERAPLDPFHHILPPVKLSDIRANNLAELPARLRTSRPLADGSTLSADTGCTFRPNLLDKNFGRLRGAELSPHQDTDPLVLTKFVRESLLTVSCYATCTEQCSQCGRIMANVAEWCQMVPNVAETINFTFTVSLVECEQ